ncbi:hypothetical protein EUGRSUZ_F00684 [Eucalyptus grandis]|uniref:Uncharacterized protein n=2 Tax=Eucalyptus grandis TaxID=71139 RepID=A0ACC3KC95_EUCGR|nr:hypothetical protein EUGRSUZ_F00684 [Eucalyptus grandis]
MGWHQILCLLCFHFCLHSSLRFALPFCPLDLHDALLHFKNSFMFDNKATDPCYWYSNNSHYQEPYLVKSYPKTNSWYKGMDCCSWDSVACDGATGNVISLNLTCSWLCVTLHSNGSLFLLHHLRNLNLSHNDFSGSQISSNLSAFATLTHLNLLGSSFSGSVPSEISCLSKLSTSFSGEIPDSIGNMKNLIVLDLENCKFTRHIPLSMWNLNQLQVLWIDGNNFCGVVEFELFTKLKNFRKLFVSQELNLIYNTLEYTILKLEMLGLRSCNLTKLPYFLNSLKRLTYLDLSSNGIGGEIPMWFWGISHDTLETFILSNNLLEGGIQLLNDFTRPLPRSLVKCANLSTLVLSHNEFSDIFLHWLEASQLYTLDLQLNKFHEAIPLPSPVTYYSIASNNITEKIPSLICNTTHIEIIDLSNNGLMGSLPQCLTNFSTYLSVLNLRMNHFEGTILEYFSSRSGLMTLDLSRNQFEGTLPQLLVKCRYLEVLDLNHN